MAILRHPQGQSAGIVQLVALLLPILLLTSQLVYGQETAPDTLLSPPSVAPIVVGTVDGPIGPASRDYLRRVIAHGEDAGAACVVIRMDTPGGLSASMRDIIQDVLGSETPIVVYVAPSGARAASAGALIALAAHVAAMAPGTNIGAAHPVPLGAGGGEKDETMEEKITHDAAAYARSIAAQRGRNVEWAEKIVRESISSTAHEALEEGVIDVVADDLDDLLQKIDGKEVDLPGRKVVLATAGSPIEEIELSWRERFLAKISDPNIAYLLMLLGVFVVAWVAGRIYKVGILMAGKRPTLPELWRWVREA